MSVYYNEFDPFAAQWLRGLISLNLIPAGDVDERSIKLVQPSDLKGYTQCHFFAGIGGWPLSLRLAEWPDDKHVWTGSCPCQPFSRANAGRKGKGDHRHLLPELVRLVDAERPSVVFGEQITGAIQDGWLDECFDSLEGCNYTCGAAIMPANGFGAEHQRKRLFWVANSRSQGWEGYKQTQQTIPCSDESQISEYGKPLTSKWLELVGSHRSLLSEHGIPFIMASGVIKGFGNAIVPQVAAEFIKAAQKSPEIGRPQAIGLF